ncbi:MAG: antibiotic biosynthesis monooxygenase [Campylobacteraceae bacterium]
MFVSARVLKLEKGYLQSYVNRFSEAVGKFGNIKGVIKSEILVSEKNKEFDVLRFYTYWENEEDYKAWHKSDEHKVGHKNGQKEKEGCLEWKGEEYFVI